MGDVVRNNTVCDIHDQCMCCPEHHLPSDSDYKRGGKFERYGIHPWGFGQER